MAIAKLALAIAQMLGVNCMIITDYYETVDAETLEECGLNCKEAYG